jgi:hypothetical protein
MGTSPVSPEDIRAAAAAHQELGPDYSDAIVASFIEKVDREVEARVRVRLAEAAGHAPSRRERRGPLVKGIVIGVCGSGALAATLAFGLHTSHAPPAPTPPVRVIIAKVGGPGSGAHKIIAPHRS